jgi:hypothetical protein
MSDKMVRWPSVHALRKAGQGPKSEHRERIANTEDQLEAELRALPDVGRGVVIC